MDEQTVLLMICLMFIIAYIISAPMLFNAKHKSQITNNLNKVYMAFFMTFLMILGEIILLQHSTNAFIIGSLIALSGIALYCIQEQIGITSSQFMSGMIEHHENAIFMAEKLLQRNDVPRPVQDLATNIIRTQTTEVAQMRSLLKE